MIALPRRKFVAGLAGLFVAPSIVRASSLMAVRALPAGVEAAAPAHRAIFMREPARWALQESTDGVNWFPFMSRVYDCHVGTKLRYIRAELAAAYR